MSQLLHQPEDWQHRPTALVDLHGRAFRKNPGNVVSQSAPGDVGQAFDHSRVEQARKRAQIADVRLQQSLANCGANRIERSIYIVTCQLEKQFSRERIAVRMQTNRWQRQYHVAGNNTLTIDYLFTIDNADDETGHVI